MGGEREDIIESAPTSQSGPIDIAGTQQQSIRIHENGGQVHFHIDAEGLKVAVPASLWWRAWDRLKNPAGGVEEFTYADFTNKSHLTVSTFIESIDEGHIVIEAEIVVKPLAVPNPIYQKLDKFTKAKG